MLGLARRLQLRQLGRFLRGLLLQRRQLGEIGTQRFDLDMLGTRQVCQIAQVARGLVGVRAVEYEFERIALSALVGGLECPAQAGLLLANACRSGFSLLRQRLQIAMGALALAVQFAQLAHRAADGTLGLAQFVGRFLTVRLRVAKLRLQGVQALLERVEFGLLAFDLVGAGAQRPQQRQQDEELFEVHPAELTRSGRAYSN